MAYYYVYCPFSGAEQWGQDCYCDNCGNGSPCNDGGYCTACGSTDCPHRSGITNLCCPIDIGGAIGTAVRFYGGSNIKSIRVIWTGPTWDRGNGCYGPNNDGDVLCGIAPPANFCWVDEGVKVELYCAYGAQGPVIGTVFYGHLQDRIANGVYDEPNGKILGYLGDQNCNNCDCYDGIHVHVARDPNGSSYHRDCGTPLSTSHPIYRWSGPDYCPV